MRENIIRITDTHQHEIVSYAFQVSKQIKNKYKVVFILLFIIHTVCLLHRICFIIYYVLYITLYI